MRHKFRVTTYAFFLVCFSMATSDLVVEVGLPRVQPIRAKASLQQDAKHKGENSGALKKKVGEWTGDKECATVELPAVVERLSKLNDMCAAKAEQYAETVERRTAEIAGLKEALSILSEGALLQRSSLLEFLHTECCFDWFLFFCDRNIVKSPCPRKLVAETICQRL